MVYNFTGAYIATERKKKGRILRGIKNMRNYMDAIPVLREIISLLFLDRLHSLRLSKNSLKPAQSMVFRQVDKDEIAPSSS